MWKLFFPSDFQGPSRAHRTPQSCDALPAIEPYLQVIWFQGDRLLKRKENSSQGSLPTSPSSVTLPYKYPHPGSGILTWFPFDRRREEIAHFKTEFPYLLGSTNPCPTAVHMEPFSTSVFKVLIWIFATTTKICTRGCFTRTHVLRLRHNLHALLLVRASHLPWRSSIGNTLERHPFSGLVHSAGELLHTP